MGIKVRDGGEPAALEHGGLDYATEDGSHTWAKQRHELYLEKRMEHVRTVQSAAADQFTCAPASNGRCAGIRVSKRARPNAADL